MYFPFWDRGAPRAFEPRHRYKKSLKPRRFQADSSTSGVLTRAGPEPAGNYFFSAFLIFLSAFFSFMVLAGCFFSGFLLSMPLLMMVLLSGYDETIFGSS
jgi:hypothetical protein